MNKPKQGINWTSLILSAVVIGAGIGVLFGVADTVFDVSFPPWVMGGISGLIVGVILTARNQGRNA